jgi:hypothetical protein
MALGYNVSSLGVYPSIRYTGRMAFDSLGTLREEREAFEGSGSQTDESDWGSHSSMDVDPDDLTFWYTAEYTVQTGYPSWSTGIVSLAFPEVIFSDGFESGDTSAWSGTVD